MHWLVEGASQNDALFLHCKYSFLLKSAELNYLTIDSGRGGTQADTSGDEEDGTDESEFLAIASACFNL